MRAPALSRLRAGVRLGRARNLLPEVVELLSASGLVEPPRRVPSREKEEAEDEAYHESLPMRSGLGLRGAWVPRWLYDLARAPLVAHYRGHWRGLAPASRLLLHLVDRAPSTGFHAWGVLVDARLLACPSRLHSAPFGKEDLLHAENGLAARGQSIYHLVSSGFVEVAVRSLLHLELRAPEEVDALDAVARLTPEPGCPDVRPAGPFEVALIHPTPLARWCLR